MYISVIVNCMDWERRFSRLLDNKQLLQLNGNDASTKGRVNSSKRRHDGSEGRLACSEKNELFESHRAPKKAANDAGNQAVVSKDVMVVGLTLGLAMSAPARSTSANGLQIGMFDSIYGFVDVVVVSKTGEHTRLTTATIWPPPTIVFS
ncbi:hypothetical protein MPTK1_7g03560 [Marchantia polymorpha subsp. ruderalis]|uniref:Uncharacterized protein n=2 Tax=Marchantia polymorpha TaxID=3197 RepID=A0AAF6BVT3_MARPO|nr:hypothetical protein MARPO_0074s0040 [Marchantia polymorpha]BBN16117.1 hypothetical protein Mp_7g03560 [Marchantia polymorpha subsp. ruderalis]|eukprot:PTQ35048.1 hypothetical protein MARPO_0074s0040 [Marchantia polymorpha]